MGTQVQAPDPRNYTIGGVRVDFDELLDEDTTPKKYSGMYSLGNIVDASFANEIENLQHYTAKTGKRVLDREVTQTITPKFTVTLDEPNARNLALMFRSSAVVDVAAAAAVAKTNETMKVETGITKSLREGFDQDNIVVTDWAGNVLTAGGDDYTVVDFLAMPGGKLIKGLILIAGGTGGLSEDDFVKVAYDYDTYAHKLIKPNTNLEVKGALRFAFVSDTGNEAWYRIQKCIVTPEGDFAYNSEDWTTFQLGLTLEEDEDNPDYPYGKWEHHGIGSDF